MLDIEIALADYFYLIKFFEIQTFVLFMFYDVVLSFSTFFNIPECFRKNSALVLIDFSKLKVQTDQILEPYRKIENSHTMFSDVIGV